MMSSEDGFILFTTSLPSILCAYAYPYRDTHMPPGTRGTLADTAGDTVPKSPCGWHDERSFEIYARFRLTSLVPNP